MKHAETKQRTARQCLKEIFKEKFDEKQRQNFISNLKTIKNVIPCNTENKKLKQLEDLRGIIPHDVYKKAKDKILKNLNGFSPDEVYKLKYYANVLETLIKALKLE